MTVAAVAQMTSTGVIKENLTVAVKLIKDAARSGAKAIFLPEASDFIAPSKEVRKLTQSSEAREFVKGVCDAAKQSSIWVSVGIHEPPSLSSSSSADEGPACLNTQLLIDAHGEITSRYRKLHLFDVDIKGGPTIKESDTTALGKDLLTPQQSILGKVGLLTCYDVRFPEPALALRRQGAQIVTYPSAFAYQTGATHWEPLLRARAIETQCYVIAAAQVGQHPGTERVSWGHAMIVDPAGTIVAQCSDMQPRAPTFCLADVNLEQLAETRKFMPLWEQRRWDVYPKV